jgi:hypothetical protein
MTCGKLMGNGAGIAAATGTDLSTARSGSLTPAEAIPAAPAPTASQP